MRHRFFAYLTALLRRRSIDAEAADEVRFHVERETEANIARGMSPGEARRVALRDLGGVTQTVEHIRDVRTLGGAGLWRDTRQGVRALTGTPRYTIVALLTTVLMVGGITTIYTLVNSVLLRPLPYPEADRLTFIESAQPKAFSAKISLPDATEFQARSQSFDAWGLYRLGYVMSVPDARNEPLTVQDLRVSPDLFAILGTRLAIGRALRPSDTDANAPVVAVISHDLWQTLYGGKDDVLGKTVPVRGASATIVGVTAPGENVPKNWLTYPIVWRAVRPSTDSSLSFDTIGRLKPGVSVERANAELAVLSGGLAAAHPATHKDRVASATLLLDEIVGDSKRVLWIFFGAVSCVLLIGAGNLMSLQLARNGAREREMVVRTALGASRGQIVRQLLVESWLLCAAGGILGLALAWPALRLIVASLPARFPRADQIGLDLGVAAFACAVSFVVGLLVAIVPAWQSSRVELVSRLNEGGRSATLGARRARLQRLLIAIETAAALVLLIGSALLANSFHRLISRDAGMDEDGLWVVSASLPRRLTDEKAQTMFWNTALEQVRQLPNVRSAAVVLNDTGPLSGGDILEGGIVPEGFTGSDPDREGLLVSARRVSGDYFSTVGMRLLKGRPILASDVDGADEVVVVNELAAARLWPGQDPIGKRLLSRRRPRTVVGVIPTYRHARLEGEITPQMFLPYRQRIGIASTAAIMLRAAPRDTQAAPAVASALTNLEQGLTNVRIASMSQVRWNLLAAERFRVAVLLAFAASAVFLALVGIFGLVAYTIGQRQREIALRVALGAVPRDVLRVASRHAVAPALAGLGLGVIVAAGATRLLTTYLVDVKPLDPSTFAASAVVLAIAAVAAALLPARQALSIDPVEALRDE